VAEVCDCAQCGGVFVLRREHARFCSVGCRVAWNREHMGDPAVETSALAWSVTAMSETADRLPLAGARDQAQALAVINEAVWWVTIIDATLVRYHLEAYDEVIAAQNPAQRRTIEETLTGLRFVRNRIGRGADLAEFAEPGSPVPDAGAGPDTGWVWNPAPEPALTWLSARGQAWEMTRYQGYQAQLAGHDVRETFAQAIAFLERTAANATPIPDSSDHSVRDGDDGRQAQLPVPTVES
jgi:hypothetical protein